MRGVLAKGIRHYTTLVDGCYLGMTAGEGVLLHSVFQARMVGTESHRNPRAPERNSVLSSVGFIFQSGALTTACKDSCRCSSTGFTLLFTLGGFGGMIRDHRAMLGSRFNIKGPLAHDWSPDADRAVNIAVSKRLEQALFTFFLWTRCCPSISKITRKLLIAFYVPCRSIRASCGP